jgi:hypothetical protein
MTWLGKIFAVLVLALSVATAWFITTTWVTRTNWKRQADEYQKMYAASAAARQVEYDSYRTEVESLRGQLASIKNDLASAHATREEAEREAKTAKDNAVKVAADFSRLSKTTTDVDAKVQTAQKMAELAQARSVELENENANLQVARNRAEREQVAAESGRRRAEGIADMLARRLEDMNTLVTELRAAGGSNPQRAVENWSGVGPVPVPEHLRGTVTHVEDKNPQTGIQGELVQISLGLDAGLRRGAVLELSRENGTGKYLGTVVIDSVWPKYAVGVFRPADPTKPLRRLKADEFPKVGDTVRVQDANRTTTIGR